jgi:hypothetical protein
MSARGEDDEVRGRMSVIARGRRAGRKEGEWGWDTATAAKCTHNTRQCCMRSRSRIVEREGEMGTGGGRWRDEAKRWCRRKRAVLLYNGERTPRPGGRVSSNEQQGVQRAASRAWRRRALKTGSLAGSRTEKEMSVRRESIAAKLASSNVEAARPAADRGQES